MGQSGDKVRLMRGEKLWKAAPQNDMGGRGAGGGCRGLVWRQWEAREKQVGMSSWEMRSIVGSDIMRSEFYGRKCRRSRWRGDEEGNEEVHQ